MSRENESLSPDLDSLSPDSKKLSPEDKEDVSNNKSISNACNTCVECTMPSDPRNVHRHSFYYCTEHPKFQNIHIEVIEGHLILASDHKKGDREKRSID
jgi:hypothetical protein